MIRRHNKHHQHANPWGWDSSTDSQVYPPATSSPQHALHHQDHPNIHRTFNYDEEEQRLLDSLQTLNEFRLREHAAAAGARVKKPEPYHPVDQQEDINEEAEEFIETKRKKFASRLTTMEGG